MSSLATDYATAEDVDRAVEGAVRSAFEAMTADSEHDPHRLSLSKLGGCTKAAAYTLAQTDLSDPSGPDEARAANLGRMQHAGLLPYLAKFLPGASYETPVVLRAAGIEIPGTMDLHWGRAALDLKTVGEWRLHGVRRSGAYKDHEMQVWGYVLARMQSGLDTRWATWLYLDRASGDQQVITKPFTNAAVMAVIDRVSAIAGWAETPDRAPREGRGPGLSFGCDHCPWLRRCWGPTAQPGKTGAQRILAHDNPAIERLLHLYDDARARASAADLDKRFARAALDQARRGIYGPWTLRWTKTTGDQTPSLMVKLMAALETTAHGRKELAALRADDTPDN